MWKGVTAIHAWPLKVSSASACGTSFLKTADSIGQWANNRSCQVCAMIHGPAGKRHGRCATLLSAGCTSYFSCVCCSSLCYQCYHVIQYPVPASHLFHAYALVIPMLGAAFLRRRGVRRESIGINSQRTVALVFGVPAGQPRSEWRARKIMCGDL